MVLVSHKYKFIYIKNKKVAGSSVESFFGKYCIHPNKPYHYNDEISEHIDEFGIIGCRLNNNFTKWYNHKCANEIKKDIGEKIFEKYFKFCVIRNPYDKMVSFYFFTKQNKNMSFKDFCKKYDVNNMIYHSIHGESVCDFFIRYENIKEDIIKVCTLLNIDNFDITNLPNHKSECRKNKNYKEFYDEETKKIVYDKHKEEFELFGYEF